MEPHSSDPDGLPAGAERLHEENPPGGSGGPPPPPLPPTTSPTPPEPRGSAGLTIPSEYWCMKHETGVCVRPRGHSGKCAVKFGSEGERNTRLLRHLVAWHAEQERQGLTNGGQPSDDEEEDEEEGATGGSGGGASALTALPPQASTQDLQRLVAAQARELAGVQAQLSRLLANFGTSSSAQTAHGAAGPAAAAGVVAVAAPTAAGAASGADLRLDLLSSMLSQPEAAAAAAGAITLPAALAGGLGGISGSGPAGGAGSSRPFIPDPSQVTNATAATIPGLNAAASQLMAAHSLINVPSALPIPISGFGPSTGGPGAPAPGGQALGGFGVGWGAGGPAGSEAVPPQPVLPEHVAGLPAYGLPTQETALTLSVGLNNETTLRPASLPTGVKRHLAPAQLVLAMPSYASYLSAGLKVCQTLAMHQYSLVGMQQFQGVMLHIAQRINHPDPVEWGMFLELDRTLRLIQHAYRLRWDHEGGYICTAHCNDFMSQIAGRHAALAVQASAQRPLRAPKAPPQSKPFRSNPGGEQGGGAAAAQPPANECGQWWRTGRCSFGARCKFEHVCRQCGSTEHGTGQCPARRGAR